MRVFRGIFRDKIHLHSGLVNSQSIQTVTGIQTFVIFQDLKETLLIERFVFLGVIAGHDHGVSSSTVASKEGAPQAKGAVTET